MVKSRLFTTVFDDAEAENAKTFARHLRETLELSEEDRQVCVDAYPEVKATRTDTQESKLVSELASRSAIPRHTLVHALRVVGFLVEALLSEAFPDDDCEHWADDLRELGWVDGNSRPVFDALLERLISARSELRFQRRERSTTGGVLPCFTSMGCTVEVRPIRKEIFRWGQPVETYVPEILGTVMVASIHIGVDEGATEDFYFQADEKHIDNIIDSLRAAKKEMTAMREFLRLDSTGKIRHNE